MAFPAGQRPAAPDFTATSLTGAPINFASYRGKIVVLNVWGSWCAPCQAEAQTLKSLDEQYSPQGIAFLGDDIQDTPANALGFLRGKGITYPSVNDASGAVEERLAIAVPINGTPTTLVIDKTGLTGEYAMQLNWTPDDRQGTADAGPSIFTALEEQLGLKLEAKKIAVQVMVVDQMEKTPKEN